MSTGNRVRVVNQTEKSESKLPDSYVKNVVIWTSVDIVYVGFSFKTEQNVLQ